MEHKLTIAIANTNILQIFALQMFYKHLITIAFHILYSITDVFCTHFFRIIMLF